MQVALSALDGGYIQDYSLVLTGALVSMVPILVVFAVMVGRGDGGVPD